MQEKAAETESEEPITEKTLETLDVQEPEVEDLVVQETAAEEVKENEVDEAEEIENPEKREETVADATDSASISTWFGLLMGDCCQ